jgi:predicted RNA-binding protein YlxR (DUF448 family)/ribosomal protein L30E
MARGREPRRTCIGCRGVFNKDEVIRIVAGPAGIVLDYRERLPGRAAYVCPRHDCIGAAFTKGRLSRALRVKVPEQSGESFLASLEAAVHEKLSGLLTMARKAGQIVSGYSAVDDALRKNRVALLLFTDDVSAGTKEKILRQAADGDIKSITFSTKAELGELVGRELAGVAAIAEKGFADAVGKEAERLKGLLKQHR